MCLPLGKRFLNVDLVQKLDLSGHHVLFFIWRIPSLDLGDQQLFAACGGFNGMVEDLVNMLVCMYVYVGFKDWLLLEI